MSTYLGSRDGAGCDEGPVLGTDERQVALRGVSAVFRSFELALESAASRHALLRHSLLKCSVTNLMPVEYFI